MANARIKLTAADIAYIKANHESMTAEEMAKNMYNVSVEAVQKAVDAQSENVTVDDVMLKQNGATIMTEAASVLGDKRQRSTWSADKHADSIQPIRK